MFDEGRIGVVSLDTGKIRLLSERGFYARYVPTGHLLYVRKDTLLAAPFDRTRLEVTGPSVPVLEGVRTSSLFSKPADGSGNEERLLTTKTQGLTSSWSPDGRYLAFDERDASQGWDVWVMPLSGDRQPHAFVRTPSNEYGPGGRWQVSNQGGQDPVWARAGQELFYRAGDKMMAVDVTSGPSFRVGAPRVLFERSFLVGIYDVDSEGRFLMIRAGEQDEAPTQMTFVLEWFSELASRVPVG